MKRLVALSIIFSRFLAMMLLQYKLDYMRSGYCPRWLSFLLRNRCTPRVCLCGGPTAMFRDYTQNGRASASPQGQHYTTRPLLGNAYEVEVHSNSRTTRTCTTSARQILPHLTRNTQNSFQDFSQCCSNLFELIENILQILIHYFFNYRIRHPLKSILQHGADNSIPQFPAILMNLIVTRESRYLHINNQITALKHTEIR